MAVATGRSTEAVARRYFEAIAERDIDAMVACWEPGGTDRMVGFEDLEVPDGVRRWFEELFGAFPDWSFEILTTTTEDDRCAVRWRATGTFAGPGRFMGFEPTGARAEIEGCDVLQVHEGKVVRNDAYFDGATVARQLGVMPPRDSPLERRVTAAANAATRARRRLASAPPERIAEGVWLLRGGFARTMNVYLLEEPDGGVTAYDAGEPGMAAAILTAAAELGGLKRVILSHGDDAHRGAAPQLGVPVFCHPAEVAAAEAGGLRDYWDLEKLEPAFVRRAHAWLHDHVWDGGPMKVDGTVSEGDEIAGFRVVELPGHAPGLIALFREPDRLALVSDAFYMADMWGRTRRPDVPEDAYNLDTAQAKESLRKLADLEPRVVAPGHRGPLTGEDVPAQLRAAAER